MILQASVPPIGHIACRPALPRQPGRRAATRRSASSSRCCCRAPAASRSMAPTRELVWCSDGYERLDLRALLEQLRAAGDTLGEPRQRRDHERRRSRFISSLRGEQRAAARLLVIELSGGAREALPSMVASMLRPVLDCLESNGSRALGTARRRSKRRRRPPAPADERRPRRSERAAAAPPSTARAASVRDGRSVVPDKNLAISCDARYIAERLAAPRSDAKAPPRVGAGSTIARWSSIASPERRRPALQDPLVPAARPARSRDRSRRAVPRRLPRTTSSCAT